MMTASCSAILSRKRNLNCLISLQLVFEMSYIVVAVREDKRVSVLLGLVMAQANHLVLKS